MKCFKFVTNELKSPGDYKIINYSNFGQKITTFFDPADYGQCAAGIHVIPYLKENVDWDRVIVSRKIIILDVKSEDIVYQNDNGTGKMRVKAVTPLRLANKKEIAHIRKLACISPAMAYDFASNFDKCPKQNTRNKSCKEPFYAYLYALNVDKHAKQNTRKAACKNCYYAYKYAKYVDQCKHPKTWEAVRNSLYANDYKRNLGSY